MTSMQGRFVGLGLLFALALATGYFLARCQRPFATLPLLVHKAGALGLTALAVAAFLGLVKSGGAGPIFLPLALGAGLVLVLLFATGGILSAAKTGSAVLKAIHGLAPYAGLALVLLALFLRGRR
jgi:hypothetical protein